MALADLSLTVEPLAAVFDTCEYHADCEGRVYSCAPNQPNCPFAFNTWYSGEIYGPAGWGFNAAFMGQLDLIDLLLDHSANVDLQKASRPPWRVSGGYLRGVWWK